MNTEAVSTMTYTSHRLRGFRIHMVDRQVQQILPQQTANAPANSSFAALQSARNVILLGDPGSGKTHLFRAAAKATNGRYMTVRTFLNRPASWSDASIFLDALDEKRSGRGDDNVVDSIVQKLFERPPQ
ncbi:TPA: AAA family ATPase [Burkholderia aenigmatica]|uniref:AAA family ATPase n=1 Tax=Burkholderia sp. AU45251 TaxID=3059204 RepID=UPI0026566B29|nr:AAA family ATPase [Burkholderia sp. AU45251]HDR9482553.1 AAA family ATPase [Burkholderia aenigmatica]MDN7517713.1 AAA family ATPase [Burkholderia sp. AU45251]HDR9513500.1 AAA family ATPase [Burkholderia aenigmatica]HDR9590891.1 AAA family ATPase [Burkholderia aenigmatica]HDR9601679.1 AAA family ATPase [Burkholderia aenigmatica]